MGRHVGIHILIFISLCIKICEFLLIIPFQANATRHVLVFSCSVFVTFFFDSESPAPIPLLECPCVCRVLRAAICGPVCPLSGLDPPHPLAWQLHLLSRSELRASTTRC